MTDPNTIKKLKDLRAMWKHSSTTPGEKVNAEKLYSRLLEKCGLTDEDIAADVETTIVWFTFASKIEKRLLKQIVANLTESRGFDDSWTNKGKKLQAGFSLTEAETVKVRAIYKALKVSLKKEIETFFRGFIQKNNLGVKGSDEEKELSPEELAELEKMIAYARNITATEIPETNKNRMLEKAEQ